MAGVSIEGTIKEARRKGRILRNMLLAGVIALVFALLLTAVASLGAILLDLPALADDPNRTVYKVIWFAAFCVGAWRFYRMQTTQ